jgi:hypothetical protein
MRHMTVTLQIVVRKVPFLSIEVRWPTMKQQPPLDRKLVLEHPDHQVKSWMLCLMKSAGGFLQCRHVRYQLDLGLEAPLELP